MKTALVIFNGIQFHFYHVNHAIDWAAKNNSSLHVLFIYSDEELPEGYLFPSDIDPAEHLYTREDAEKVNVRVFGTQIKVFQDMVREKNISSNVQELVDPPLDEIIKITEGADILFIDAAYDRATLLAGSSFKSRDLINGCRCPVEVVKDEQ